MKQNLSTNGIYTFIGAAFFLISILFNVIIFLCTDNPIIRGSTVSFSLLMLLLGIIFLLLLRNKLIRFSDSLCLCIDNMTDNAENISFDLESDTLSGKISCKLKRLYEIMQDEKKQLETERKTLQETISDISHQVKTPITNLKIYNALLSEQKLSHEKELEFHKLMESQISKLDFLMQAMIKMSRLEAGIIKLSPSAVPIYDTIALALAGIELSAEQKEISVTVDCSPNLVKALDGVSLSVAPGEFLAIVGTSGSGKSTLLHMLGGLDNPTAGSVEVNGKELSKMKSDQLTIFRRRNIGFIFQNYNLVPILNVYENITLPLELDAVKPDEAFISRIVAALGLSEKLDSLPNNLSGGQQQRVAIARALAAKPAIILADEPTGNLDSKTSQEVLGLLKMSGKQFQQTIVMITHNNEIAQLADRIIRIEDGRVMA